MGVRNKEERKALNKLDSRWSWSNKLGDFKNGAEFWDQFCRKYSTIAKTTLLEAASKCDDVYTEGDLKTIKFIELEWMRTGVSVPRCSVSGGTPASTWWNSLNRAGNKVL